jgi:regulator of PEP synthase PpsR (kinase-PPPase family)
MDLKGSKTEANLWTAFAGESQARTKYDYYASKAKKEGFVQIANFFEETARNEKEHAKIWFKLLYNGKEPRGLLHADVVLIGVSRTSKTPVSMYLANKRIKAANVPIVPEVEPPSELFRISSRKIIGLTVQPQSLLQIRQERLKSLGLTTDAEYASLSRIQKELAYADRLMAQLGCSVIDVTNKAVEETASRVLEDYYKGERDAR